MPAQLRRVVTGTDQTGQSAVVEDAIASRCYELETLGGLRATAIWETPMPPASTSAGGEPPDPLTLQPPAGSMRFFTIAMPPDTSVSQDQEAILAEITERVPSFLETADPEREFGMHRTRTIDLAYVVSGEIDLVLETGVVSLRAGDSLVQQGTWHAWRNPHDVPCVMVVAMLSTS